MGGAPASGGGDARGTIIHASGGNDARGTILFSHANGFPAGTYRVLFDP